MTAHLDNRGDIAIAEIIAYVPVLIASVFLVVRYGVARELGWVLLLTLSLVRIIGGATLIASQQDPSNVTLDVVASILVAAGVSPLLLATLGFIGTVCQYTLDNDPRLVRGLQLMSLLSMIALILAIVGGVDVGNAKTQADLSEGTKLRHVGAIFFVVLFVLIFLFHLLCWMNMRQIMKARRMLLASISFALPFLAVRVVYTVLSAYAPPTRTISASGEVENATSNSPLAKFNPTTGSWVIYLFMSVLMEYCAVLVYVAAGTRLQLDDITDYVKSATVDFEQERYNMAAEYGPKDVSWER
ncbi:hypothetical protein DAEQUDRAFT_812672 [Daedalea quercina L-15889]|uniref:DUF7702 domain-containing protein n=1 Tax=Daedalea quercina L-15889 TaxID=1314783 RepID=A0A165P081_9APHY|nr:hypothetical protein DAEQUDRAFT_812672 [Daedalea quercina L-15889]